MKPGKITHTTAVLLSSISSLFAHGVAEKAEPAKMKLSKKSEKSADDSLVSIDSIAFAPRHSQRRQNRLRAMGRCRPVSHRSLAVRFRQRASEGESQQRSWPRCFAGSARLPRLEGNRRDRLAVCRF